MPDRACILFAMAHFGPKQEKEYRRKAAHQREILEHLMVYSVYSQQKWDTLYTHYAIGRKTDIQPVLQALKDARFVEVSEDTDQIVRITASGCKRLEKQDY
jgi:hypothetical protein